MLTTISAKVTGVPDASGWSQVYEFKPDDPSKLSARGTIFTVISTKKTDGSDITTISAGRDLIGRLHDEYFGDLSIKPFNALKSAVEKVASEFRQSWGSVEIAACSVVDNVVYSVATGGAEVTICRAGALGTILKSTDENVIAASGFPQKGDSILLATKTFYEKTPLGVIKAALNSASPEISIESFLPIAQSGESGSLAAAVIKFDEGSYISTVALPVPIARPNINFDGANKIFGNFKDALFAVTAKLTKRIPERQIYVHSPVEDEVVSQNKKLTFSVAIVLLLVLVVSIVFGIRQKKSNDIKSRYQSILSAAQKDVDDAISLASVSPDRSRELFLDSEQKLDQITALKVKDPKIDELKKKIDESRGAILGEYSVSPELFLDLSLLSSGFKGDSLNYSGGDIYIFDKTGKRIVSVVISTKKSKVVAGPSVIDSAVDAASYQNRVFILGSDGVYEVDQNKTKVIDKSWSGDALIKAFAGNIYILDKSGNAIYRFAGNGSSFGEKQNWLAAGTRVDFSDTKQFVIDGSMYTLFPNSKILKFSLGSPQNFSVSGVIPEIGTIDAMFAGEDNQNVYLLDRAGKRIVAIDKKGKYVAQYMSDQISKAINLAVSEADKKIILLTGDKLFSIDLKN